MPFIACKLPHGLSVRHEGKTLDLNGPNEGSDPLDPMKNGAQVDSGIASAGYGLTQVTDDQVALFNSWKKAMLFASDGKTKLNEPFVALENGSIMGPFGSIDEARAECQAMSDMVRTGFEGIDPATDPAMKAAGIETDPEAGKATKGK